MNVLNMESYTRKCEEIKSQLLELKELDQTLSNTDFEQDIMEVMKNFNEDQFQVVVVGEFSRGKSTFINAMLGKKILPSSALPTTTIINKITYNDIPSYQLIYRDETNSPKLISEEEFKQITAPTKPLAGNVEAEEKYQKQLEDIQKIKFAEVEYPLPVLQNNVKIIDTPGTNDVDEVRVKITQNFMPQSDAAIFVLSAKKILAESEMNFLKFILKEDIQRVFFVINHADVLRTDEKRKKVFDHAKEALAEQFPDTKIYMISSKNALNARRVQQGEEVKGKVPPFEQTGFAEFEEALGSFLMDERAEAKIEKPITSGIRLANEMKRSIHIERQTLYKTATELEEDISKMKPELSRFRQSIDEIRQSYETMILKGRQDISRILQLGLENIASSAVRTIQAYDGDLNGDAIQSRMESVVAPLQSSLQSSVRERQREILQNALTQAQKRYVREWGKMEETLSTVLVTKQEQSTTLVNHQVTYDTAFVSEGDDSVKTGIAALGAGIVGLNVIGSIGLAGLFFAPILIPIAFLGIGGLLNSLFGSGNRQRIIAKVRAQVEDRYRGQIPVMMMEFERQWDENARVSAEHFFTQSNKKLKGIEDQLTSILESKQQEELKATEREAQLEQTECRIDKVVERLERMKHVREVELV
ncbi:dynamin family protein [Rossellomorea sp. NPDC077527]|uniref:dynamin family protein n=1 Tax=Rossellomorea sp. NPDC077527 TaxID=3364510 RepID=UPI0037C642E2